ncbi:hypothetical protein I302_105043 [Kwoniella bestiolae CBS 10118]|uniref:Subtelomeric hrmA-associated cluster protein AFUB-079030/YDR124W-like helical bundle domain-containing protein n=1 Tax=Kwoniella bestiolae CBS 10118 TaxID=1296100 RepID=A0A1B9FR38_9TREE|nr:hypothetical protein I302_08883 [Kwoniella bestiolae CBS 10118]OCF21212.1 hypothetical protein I302_08883 [Kwoniella bestiolae CBS 10118]
MPRIPVRTTPYHALPRCTRHYKSKRDLILRALGKASFINGSQFVIAWISPKGDTDIFASELLQSAVKDTNGNGGVLNKKELEKEAARVKQEMVRRWDEIRRMEEKGEQPPSLPDEDLAIEENDEEVGDEVDPDKTMVDEEDSLDPIEMSTLETPLKANGTGLGINAVTINNNKKLSPTATTGGMYSTFPMTSTTPRSLTPSSTSNVPMQTIVLKPEQIEGFYMDRFTNLQQQTCKLVVKAWIKIIEPKKQMKFPYNKGEEFKPTWWPDGVKHREPDHLPKDERKLLLMSIIRNPSVNVARLQLSTAETSALISASKLAILREIYIVAKEEERRRQAGDTTSDLTIELPITTSNGSPEPSAGEKRSHSDSNKENINYDLPHAHTHGHVSKKAKNHPRLPALALSTQQQNQFTYDSPYTTSPSPFAFTTAAPAPQHLSPHVWGETRLSNSATSSSSTAALSPYGYATSDVHSEYSRSPNPEHQQQQQQQQQRQYSNQHHLAPILTHHGHSHGATSPAIDSPYSIQGQGSAGYFPQQQQQGQRGLPNGYMQQQQMEYLHHHHHQQQQQDAYGGFQSPYIAEQGWEGQYSQAA